MISVKKWIEIESMVRRYIPGESVADEVLNDLKGVLKYNGQKNSGNTLITIKKWAAIQAVMEKYMGELSAEPLLNDLRDIVKYDPEVAKNHSRTVTEHQRKCKEDPTYVPRGRGRPRKVVA